MVLEIEMNYEILEIIVRLRECKVKIMEFADIIPYEDALEMDTVLNTVIKNLKQHMDQL